MRLTLDEAKHRLELAKLAALKHPGRNEYQRAVGYFSSLLAQCEKRIANRPGPPPATRSNMLTRREAVKMFGLEFILSILGSDPWYWDGDCRIEYLMDWQVEQLQDAQQSAKTGGTP